MSWPTEPPANTSQLFGQERERLLVLLGGLDQDAWARPSPCPGWSVLGLATHLVGDDFSLLARHRDGYLGTAPPDGTSPDGFITWLDELQNEWVRAARRMSPALVVQLLAWAGPQLVETMKSADPRELSANVSWAGEALAPVWLDQVRELSEYWIHRQQLRWALGLATDLDAAVLGPILDGFRWAYPCGLAGSGTRDDAVVIEVTGDVERRWALVASATGWQFVESAVAASAAIRMDADQAWRLLTNNLPPDQHGAIEVSGDEAIVRALLRTRAIIGAPNA